MSRKVYVSAGITLASLMLAAIAAAFCVPTIYSRSGTPPPTANWTDTTYWTPNGGFPGCAPGDAVQVVPSSPTTIVVNSSIPNPIIGLNLNCAGCVIDVQPGGSLTLAGGASIGSGATLQVSGGTLTIANVGNLTLQSGATLALTSGSIDVQSGGHATLSSAQSLSGGTLTMSGGRLTVNSGLTIQNGATLDLNGGTIDGSSSVTNNGIAQANGTNNVSAAFNVGSTGSVTVSSGQLSLSGGGTGDGPFSLANGATLDFPSGTYTTTPNGIINGSGTLSISGGTLSAGGVTQPDQLHMTAGTLTGAGFLSVTNFFDWRGGTLTGSGTAELAGTGSADFYGTAGTMVLDNKTFNNYGVIDYQPSPNPLQLANGALFADYGTFDVETDGTIAGTTPAKFLVAPNGVLEKSGGSGTMTIAPPLDNNATAYTFSGTLQFDGGGTHNGSFNAFGSGNALVFTGSDTFTNSSSFGGDGTLTFRGTASINGYFDVGGTTEVRGGSVTFADDARTNVFTFDGGSTTVPLNDALTITGSGTWSAGTLDGSGSVTVGTNATFVIDAANADVTLDGLYFRNDGTVQYTATTNSLTFANAALVDNYGTFDIQADQAIHASAVTPIAARVANEASAAARARHHDRGLAADLVSFASEIDNNSGATFEKSGGGGTSDIEAAFSNDGTVLASSGTLNFLSTYDQSGGTTTLDGGDIEVASSLAMSGGSLTGSGTIDGDVDNGGDVAPGDTGSTGTINVTGSYTQQSGGTLTTKLASAASYDVLAVSGSATLDGTHDVTLIGGYEPANAQTFTVLTFASRSGDFATRNYPTYASGHGSITSNYTPTSLVLTAVVTPSSADLAMSMSGPASVTAAAPLSYDITITNNGPDTTSGTITVVDTLPIGATGVSANGSGWSCGAATTTITCTTSSSIANAAQFPTLTISMTAPASGGNVSNSATVSSANDANNANDSDSVTTTVIAEADLLLSKTGPANAVAGQPITYTITVTNNGPSTADNVIVSDPTPAGLTFVSNSGACTSTYPCTLGTLTAGQSATITSTYSSDVSLNGNVTNTATVSSTTGDPDNSNDSASATTHVTPTANDADLSLIKSGPPSVTAGQNVTYTITVTNNGPLAANNIFVDDPTPAGVTFVANSGACTNSYPCGLGTLTAGQTATITSTYNVPASYASGSVANTATVSSSTPDTNSANNSSTATTTVTGPPPPPASADLAIARIGPSQAAPGDHVTFTITVTNNGPANATAVVVSDPTPAGLTFVSNSGACTTPYPCSLGTLNATLSTVITTTYLVSATTSTTIVDTSTVSGAEADPVASNNTRSSTLQIVTCPSDVPVLTSPAADAVVTSPVTFRWTPVAAATSYTVTIQGSGAPIVLTTFDPFVTAALPNGAYTARVTAIGDSGCGSITSTPSPFVVCNTPPKPVVSVVGEATTGQTYNVTWSSTDSSATFELQEATSDSFDDAVTFTVQGNTRAFTKNVDQAKRFFYRVRGVAACGQSAGFSAASSIVIVPLPDPRGVDHSVVAPAGSTHAVTFQVFVPGLPAGSTSFIATVDKPWLSVTPTSGIITPDGLLLTISADPTSLPNGTWTGTIFVVYGDVRVNDRLTSQGSTTLSIPISISLVTPVDPAPLTTPGSNALVIPAVGHLAGVNSNWQSDVRLANTGALAQQFRLSFNRGTGDPSDGVRETIVTVDAGATMALDDIVRNWYGIGSLGDSSNGTLVIEPLSADAALGAIVSSRTYNLASGGTLGQFIPAVPFRDFIGAATHSILALQQIAQNGSYRTNLGLVESAGKPANVLVSVFDGSGNRLLEVPVSLNAGEQRQLNGFLAANNLSLANGHVEVQVTDGEGLVTAYASVIDNASNDPMLASGVRLGSDGATRFIVPGVANLDTGIAHWRTDLRIFNSSMQPQPATLTFFPNDPAAPPSSQTLTVNPGEVKALDDVLQSFFGVANIGGAVHVTTPAPAPLIVTGRTYDETAGGTLGQLIPAVTPSEAVGSGERTLQILQAEQSVRYRTNLGLAEVTGHAATVEVSVVLPDSKITPVVTVPLAPFQSTQIPILTSFGLDNIYNARITVRVVDGDGRVTAYGSVVDMQTQAPTYIPAQ
ncbi:MAG: DUF11 domain-containing protein [Acidobacteria bacterium]|nr:DUF11 domain-containing protein [Acidobacteriota bacterium]MBV9476723.1 DUF11 domain-containing protein [Acidobacteriota bacterium]